MGVPAKMENYPVPAGIKRSPSNDCWSSRLWDGVHGGNDIKPSKPGQTGEGVYPAWKGEVWFFAAAGSHKSGTWGSDYGNRLLIRHKSRHTHANGTNHFHDWFTFYAHLKSMRVTESGLYVLSTTLLAGVGDTGNADGPHVHFALQLDPGYKQGIVDPNWLLNNVRDRLLAA